MDILLAVRYHSPPWMEADLGDAGFLTMFAASMAANMFTALAVIGIILFSKHERDARVEGRKVKAPPYVYALILLPAAMMIATVYAVSSSGAANL